MKPRPLTDTLAKIQPAAHREDAFASISGFTGQVPFPFLMAALVTSPLGVGNFSIDRLLLPWFERISGKNRLSS